MSHPELAPVELAKESWTRVDVDDGGDRDEQDEADQPDEESSSCSTATELERQKHFQTNHAVFAP